MRNGHGWKWMRAAAFAALTVWAPSAFAASDEFILRPQTRIKVAIIEWVASLGEYKEWTALNGEYQVSSSGTISVPLIGAVQAAGKSGTEVSDIISGLLQKRTGLSQLPVTTVEIVRYPPVYVTGPVQKPGEIEFKPGLTVMQAVAMAGGRERRIDAQGGYSELDQIRYLGDLNRIELQLKQFSARRARLHAELEAREAVVFPDNLVNAEAGSIEHQFMEEEKRLFATRAEALGFQLQSLDELVALLEREITVLDEKMVTQDRQIKTAENELKDVARLVSDQTLTKSRQTSLERIVADLQSGKLDMVVASMRAKQKVSETRRDAITLRGQRKTEAGRDLQATDAEIEDLKLRRVTALQLLQSMGASVLRKGRQELVDLQPLEFRIARDGSNNNGSAEATETDALEPGDVLEVRFGIAQSVDGTTLGSVDAGQGQPDIVIPATAPQTGDSWR